MNSRIVASTKKVEILRVFISHASSDNQVARRLERKLRACGVTTFLDCEHIEYGDYVDERLIDEAHQCSELVVLFTPQSLDRKYVWLEIGMFLGAKKRIVVVLYGVKKEEIMTDQSIPVALRRINFVELNNIDSYLTQLKGRCNGPGNSAATRVPRSHPKVHGSDRANA